MRPADREALDLLKAASGRDVAPAVWAQIEQQVEQVGLRGLTGSSRTVIDHAVAKHGSHNQQSHAGGGGLMVSTNRHEPGSNMDKRPAGPKVGSTVGLHGVAGRWKVKGIIPKAKNHVGEDLYEVESGGQRRKVTRAKMTDAPEHRPTPGLSAGRAGLDALYKEEGQ
jgi:hypothetical protein